MLDVREVLKLYYIDKYSLPEIADIYECHVSTVRRAISKEGFGVRKVPKGRCEICGEIEKANGYCNMHLHRVRTTGSPGPEGRIRPINKGKTCSDCKAEPATRKGKCLACYTKERRQLPKVQRLRANWERGNYRKYKSKRHQFTPEGPLCGGTGSTFFELAQSDEEVTCKRCMKILETSE